MSSAREDILARIRSVSSNPVSSPTADYAAIVRTYTQSGACRKAEVPDLFADRLRDYGCGVFTCDRAGLSQTISRVLNERAKRKVLVPPGFHQSWLPSGFEFSTAVGLSLEDIDKAQGVITGCSLAIALTGTIAIAHSPEEGSRALTLIPDYHLCIVIEDQIVETVPEGIQRMAAFAGRPLTTISGPSATSDIEMTRVKGVHGPRTLDVIVVRRSGTSL